jgi:chromosome segregation ATPase
LFNVEQGMLDDAQRNAETWQDKHREAASQLRVLSDKSRQAAALADEYEQDLETSRRQLEDERSAVSSLQVRSAHARAQRSACEPPAHDLQGVRCGGPIDWNAMMHVQKLQHVRGHRRHQATNRIVIVVDLLQEQLSKVKNELASVRSDSEQLKSLAMAGDRSQGELEGRLTSQAAELRACQMKVQQLQADLQQRLELYEEAKMQRSDALSTIRQLDGERDKMQAELDNKVEELAVLEQAHTEARGRVVVLEQSGASLEQRLVHADKHVQQLQHELQAAAEREDVARRDLVSLRQDYERLQARMHCYCHARTCGCATWQTLQPHRVLQRLHRRFSLLCVQYEHHARCLQEENVALAEDLAVMVKENQLVSGQLGQTAQHADESRDELRKLQTNNGVLQQTLKARELELEDLRAAYEDLAAEDRQHQSEVGQLKRQLGGYNVELESAKQEVVHLQVRPAMTHLAP